jgi:quercetin dioxygenase-like cupin family protein
MTPRSSRRFGLLGCIVLLWVTSAWWVNGAEQRAAQTPAVENPANFTGKSTRMDPAGMTLGKRGFEASARANWHTHDAGQLLFVDQGGLRYQVEAQPMKELKTHESTYLPGGVAHWHGALPGQAVTQVSIQFGPGIKWMEKVTDDQYAGKTKR